MKLNPLREKRGIALVVVLVFLVLLSIFIIGFFSNSQDELTAAQSFTGEVSASHLAESAVSVVMGQIREATSRTNGAWGSQPGMIRVYRDGDNASDKADAFFKLYSSDDMVVSGSEIQQYDPMNEVKEDSTSNWQNQPALWTDLNEAVKVPKANYTGSELAGDDSDKRYPIVDPWLEGRVEGLTFKNVANNTISKARMPVKWLYVLKDGTLTAPTLSGGQGTKATWNPGERAPTAANPIVGRIAFWTDDETCKININTAGGFSPRPTETNPPPNEGPKDGGKPRRDEVGTVTDDDYAGSFWDTPRFFTVFDRGVVNNEGVKGSNGKLNRGGLALSQPVRNEFQRYPGHPSTTSLGLAFRRKTGTVTQDSEYLLTSGQLALLTPRLMFSKDSRPDRASNYGTDRLLAADYRKDPIDPIESNDVPVNPRVKRLYASVDEMFYGQPDKAPIDGRRVQNEVSVGLASENDNASVLTAGYLEKMRFILTAHSRAPELNLFGQPRVTIWPVWEVTGSGADGTSARTESEYWNASDRLIAYCSTIGPKATPTYSGDEKKVLRYIFQRRDAYTADTDIKISRNDDIIKYLQRITNKPFPGFGSSSFKDKYATSSGDSLGRDQLLVEMFDYIRCVNLRDSTRDKKINERFPSGTLQNIQEKEKYKYAPRGLVVPAVLGRQTNKRHGFGRFPTVSEASIVLYVSGYTGMVLPKPEPGKPVKPAVEKRFLNSRPERNEPLDRPGFLKPDSQDQLYQTRWITNLRGEFLDNYGEVLPDVSSNKPQRMKVKDVLVRAFFITEMFNPMQGYAPTTVASVHSREQGYIVMEIENLDKFTLDGTPLGFPSGKIKDDITYSSGNMWGGRNSGGSEGFMHTMWKWDKGTQRAKNAIAAGGAEVKGLGDGPWYPFQTAGGKDLPGIKIPYETAGGWKTTALLQGPEELKIKIYYSRDEEVVRHLVLNFNSGPTGVQVPMPHDEVWSQRVEPYEGTYYARWGGGFSRIVDPAIKPDKRPDLWACASNIPILFNGSSKGTFPPEDRTAKSLGDWFDSDAPPTNAIKPGRLSWVNTDSNNHINDSSPGFNFERRWAQVLQPGDVVRSVVYGNAADGLGDLRVSCLAVDDPTNASAVYHKHPDWSNPGLRHAQTLRGADSGLYYPSGINKTVALDPSAAVDETRFGNVVKLAMTTGNTGAYPTSQAADLPPGLNGVKRKDNNSAAGDFDTGIGNLADGAFCGKADEGNLAFRQRNNLADGKTFSHWTYPIPYFTWSYEETFDTFFSPNRQVPSPVVFGSLLAGKATDWTTLCFSPNPAGANHPGLTGPVKDYLWLDLFTMPVVEPYAISEPFSTAGKVNLNYPIVPFPHITRSTALRAALQPVRVTGVPAGDVNTFKTGVSTTVDGITANRPVVGKNYRYVVDRNETIKAFDAYFEKYTSDRNNGFLKSAAQICEFYLYPRGGSTPLVNWSKDQDAIKQWWRQQTLTGDNVREKPYADLYPRITTKSNTFTVHVRAQTLRQSASPSSVPGEAATHYRTWDEKRDRVVSEYRGSSIIERYIDPQDERFNRTKTATFINPDLYSIDPTYRFRVLSTKRFNP